MITEESKFDAVILGDGDFPFHGIPTAILKCCRYLCCCDHAGPKAMSMGLVPDAIVGDGDSMPPGFRDKYQSLTHIIDEQDDNDQTKATRFCMERGLTHIAYLGATGKREDHTIGNISLLATYVDELCIHPVMVTDHGYFVAAHGHNTFGTRPHRQVSIFNISCSNLQGDGLKWQLYPFGSLWQGTLNEATSDSVTIDSDGTYIIYFTFEGKEGEGGSRKV